MSGEEDRPKGGPRSGPPFGRLAVVLVFVLLAVAIGSGRSHSASVSTTPGNWCGETIGVDGADALSAFQIHVVYAIPADGTDRFGERIVPILDDLAIADSWWISQDPTRTLRFDLLVSDCSSTMGRLDVTDVRLPHDAAYYADGTRGFSRITNDLEQPPLSFSSPEKKNLVYYDGPVQANHVCGTSPLGEARGSGTSVVYLASLCGDDLGKGGKAAAVAVHELIHNLRAIPRLHSCVGSAAHACDDPADIMYPSVEDGTVLAKLRLDVGHDDYYGLTNPGTWFDVRTSPFLQHLDDSSPPPVEPRGFTAVSQGSRVNLSWPAATAGSRILYRIYKNGALLTETPMRSLTDTAAVGDTLVYALRAGDAAGRLTVPAAIRVQVGLGVVDDSGELVPDTIPPPQVTGLRAAKAPAGYVLSWRPVIYVADLAGYRVFRNAKPFGTTRTTTSLKVRASEAHAAWSVAAIDRAGNLGKRSTAIRVP